MKGQKGYALAGQLPEWRFFSVSRLGRCWLQIRRWQQLAKERRMLAMLDDAALKDIGLSRADAMQESERPFWDDSPKC